MYACAYMPACMRAHICVYACRYAYMRTCMHDGQKCLYLHAYMRIIYSLRDAPPSHQRLGRSVDRSVDCSAARSLDRSLGRSLGRSIGRSVARWIGRSISRSISRSDGRLVVRLIDRSIAWSITRWLSGLVAKWLGEPRRIAVPQLGREIRPT